MTRREECYRSTVDLGLLLVNYHYSFVPIIGPVLVLQEEQTETLKIVVVVIRPGAGTGNAHIARATRVLLSSSQVEPVWDGVDQGNIWL